MPLDQWQIMFHETMAALLRAKESIQQQLGLFGMLNRFWTCTRDLKSLNSILKTLSEAPDGLLSQESVASQIVEMRKIVSSLNDLMDISKRHGLFNRSLTSIPLGSIRLHGEVLADYLDSLEMATDPEVLQAIEEGRRQIENGEFVEMEHIG